MYQGLYAKLAGDAAVEKLFAEIFTIELTNTKAARRTESLTKKQELGSITCNSQVTFDSLLEWAGKRNRNDAPVAR